MTCRGYDPKAVKISKSVKRQAANILDDHMRGKFIKSFVEIAKSENRSVRKEKSTSE
jgi:hypothetical protein